MGNPRITIETYLEKIKKGDIKAIGQQLRQMSGQVENMTSGVAVRNRLITESMEKFQQANGILGRGITQSALRTKIATQQINSFREAWLGAKLVMKDMISVTGMANAALNILISRFGTMVVVFGAVQLWQRWTTAMAEAALIMDTARIKVESLVIPTTTLEAAMDSLMQKMVVFGITVGGSFEQLSDSMFFLASSGLDSAHVGALFAEAQKLVIVTSKDLNATLSENKQILETFAGVYKNFAHTLTQFNTEQERAAYIADLIFYAFKRNQILLPELASGFTYAAAQANIMRIPLAEITLTMAKANSVMIKGSKAGTSYANALSDIIKRAPALAEHFGITIDLDKEEGFSFINEVLVPLNEQMEQAGNRVEFLTKMMAVFNKRGLRLTAGLLPKARELSEEYKNIGDAIGERETAAEKVIGSLKNQLQITKNLKIVINDMAARAIHGGRERKAVQKQINDFLSRELGTIIQIIAAFAALAAVVIVVADSIIFLIRGIWNLIEMAGALFEAMREPWNPNAWKKAGADIKKQWGDIQNNWQGVQNRFAEMDAGIKKIYDFGAKPFNNIEEAIESLLTPAEKLAVNLANIEATQKLMAKTSEAVIKTLGREKSYYDRYGMALDATAYRVKHLGDEFDGLIESAMSNNLNVEDLAINFILTEEDVDKQKELLVNYAEASKKTMEDIFDSAETGDFFKDFQLEFESMAKSFPDAFDEATDITNRKVANLVHVWDKAREEIRTVSGHSADQLVEVDKRYWAEIIALAIEGKEELDSIVKRFLDKELNDYKYQTTQLIQELKDRYAKYTMLTSGIALQELTWQGIAGIEFEDLIFDPDEFNKARQVMTDKMDEILGSIDKDIGVRLGAVIADRGIEFAKIGPEFKQAINAMYEKAFEDVADIGRRSAEAKEKEAFDEFIAKVTEAAQITEDKAAMYANLIRAKERGDTLTPIQEKSLQSFYDSIGQQKGRIIDVFTNRIKAIRRELESLLKEFFKFGDSRVGDALSIEAEALDESTDNIKKYRNAITVELGIISDNFNNIGDVIVEFTNVLVDENNRALRSMADTVKEMLNMTARLIDMYLTYRQTQSSLQAQGFTNLLGLNTIGLALGAASAVGVMLSSVADIWRDSQDEVNSLGQEFLPQDSQARVSADYGQARVVNQRISLNPIFQFLDPSQLNESQQRRLAVAIYDNLLELEKESG